MLAQPSRFVLARSSGPCSVKAQVLGNTDAPLLCCPPETLPSFLMFSRTTGHRLCSCRSICV